MEKKRQKALWRAAGTGEDAQTVAMDGRGGKLKCQLRDMNLSCEGEEMELSVRLKGVRPHRRVALAVELMEGGTGGRLEKRGLRTALVAAHGENGPRDVWVEKLTFVLPGELSLAGEDGQRRFLARVTAHYVDFDDPCACALKLST